MKNVDKPPFAKQVTLSKLESAVALRFPTLYFCKLMHIYKWSSYSKLLSLWLLSNRQRTNKSGSQHRRCRMCLLSLGGVIRIAIFKLNNYYHTIPIFNASLFQLKLKH